jgi:hypothetical protein
MSLAFIHSGKSFMPEIAAYQNYFESAGLKTVVLINPSQVEMAPHEILWFFMGMQPALSSLNKKKIIIHEYCSASTAPFARWKDLVKKLANPAPTLRITLTPAHEGVVFPADNVPLIVREQGVHPFFFTKKNNIKDYDFIYTGSALKIRKTGKWLHRFLHTFPAARILLVGNHEPEIIKQFTANSNIQFKSQVPVDFLPELLSSAHFAVNYVPDVYPFNIQPSTKLLEYCAAGCRIISNRYAWVDAFAAKTKAGIFFIDDNFENLSSKNLEQFDFVAPPMPGYQWKDIFEKMRLQRYLPI